MIGTPDRHSLPMKARVNVLAVAFEKAWLLGAGPGNTAQAPLSFGGALAAAEFGGGIVFFVVMCIVEIRPGRGGRDAEEFAGSIARAISAWSVRHNQPAGMSGSGTRSITLTLPRTPVTALR